MIVPNSLKTLLTVGATALLAACGGGGGGGVASTPPPPPSSTPTPPPAAPVVTIFANPTPQQFASIGASTTSAGDGYTPVAADARLTEISFDAADQPRIRYNAAGYYEIQLPGSSYDRLVHYKGLAEPTADNNFFQPGGAAQNEATFTTLRSRQDGYGYSELASWTKADDLSGYIAFGMATPAAAIPVSGSATYRGPAFGMVDITFHDNLYGGYYFISAGGTVTLNVDFGKGTLGGALALSIAGEMNPREIGSFAIAPIALTAGVNGFSGRFETGQPGFNQFDGLFTGPAAQEAIGAWALPVTIDGQAHQAMGAWIAKRD